MKRTVDVKMKTVYGVDRIYPACDHAAMFTSLTGKTTFSKQDISVIKNLGFEVVLVNNYTL